MAIQIQPSETSGNRSFNCFFGTKLLKISWAKRTVHLPSSTHNWKFKLFAGSVSTTYNSGQNWRASADPPNSGGSERLPEKNSWRSPPLNGDTYMEKCLGKSNKIWLQCLLTDFLESYGVKIRCHILNLGANAKRKTCFYFYKVDEIFVIVGKLSKIVHPWNNDFCKKKKIYKY